MEWGTAHGRVPIAATAKSNRFRSSNTTAYQGVVHENEQMKERNDALNEANTNLNENNEILVEESSVYREMMLVMPSPSPCYNLVNLYALI